MNRDYLRDKSVGFWFSAGLSAFSLITAAVYAGCYAGTDDMSWAAFVFILFAAISGGTLIALKQYKYAPYAIAVFVFLSLLFFIYGIYYYVSVVMVGIDLDTFDPQFIVCALFFMLAFGLSIANLFLKQIKDGGRKDEQEN